MDKKLILAVAGAGKTTYIINNVKYGKRTLILTYTDANYENIIQKIRIENNGVIPDNVTVFTYFGFLYQFCYKPFLADIYLAQGISFEVNKNKYVRQNDIKYFMDQHNRFYSNRFAFFFEKCGIIDDIIRRIEKYFDVFIIDEIQDLSGRDFNFLEKMMSAKVDIMFVGDFNQHTYSTSFDGNVNQSLFDDISQYKKRFEKKGIVIDEELLQKSWRCGEQVCEFIRKCLQIEIYSNVGTTGDISFIVDESKIEEILNDDDIVKLHYQKASGYGANHRNWGETKGEDCYQDVCVLLNKTTLTKYKKGELSALPATTKNKLYVALTRAKGNVYLIDEACLKYK